jgi:hypothetical protein
VQPAALSEHGHGGRAAARGERQADVHLAWLRRRVRVHAPNSERNHRAGMVDDDVVRDLAQVELSGRGGGRCFGGSWDEPGKRHQHAQATKTADATTDSHGT